MKFAHIPVLLNEALAGLDIKSGGIYLDGTAGGAGHSIEIAKQLTTGQLIALDRDPDAVAAATKRLADYRATVVKSNYSDMANVLADLGIGRVDGILLDLGVSSHQLDDGERGFSYHNDAPLDMRMSREGLCAADVINGYSLKELSRILFEYGEEKFANRIAINIIKQREKAPICTTSELAEIVKISVPAKVRRDKNPCKKTFQAVRMEVNGELEHLSLGLDAAFSLLKIGGRLVVITFHSLEDRLVKQRFVSLNKGCTCPPDFPQCICGKLPRARLVNKKAIEARDRELTENNRSRSAKLRILERIAE